MNELLRVDYVIVIDSGAPRAWNPIAKKIWLLIHHLTVHPPARAPACPSAPQGNQNCIM